MSQDNHPTPTSTDTDTEASDDDQWHDNAILNAMRTNATGDGERKFDARRVTAYPDSTATAYSDRPPEITNKWTLAALYYGGCHGSPTGMSQRDLADYLGVSRSEVSRRLQQYGIHAPDAVLDERSRRARRNMPTGHTGGGGR